MLRHPHPTPPRSHATARRTPVSRTHRARRLATRIAKLKIWRHKSLRSLELAAEEPNGPTADACLAAVQFDYQANDRGAARAPEGKSTRRSSRTRATGARSASTSRPPSPHSKALPRPRALRPQRRRRNGGGAGLRHARTRVCMYVVRLLMNASMHLNTIALARHGCDRRRVVLRLACQCNLLVHACVCSSFEVILPSRMTALAAQRS